MPRELCLRAVAACLVLAAFLAAAAPATDGRRWVTGRPDIRPLGGAASTAPWNGRRWD